MAEKKPLAVIAGPTAAGKTDLAILVAKRLDGEIVTADSMQVYRGLDIGTAKPSLAEQAGVPHHLIDVVDPGEPFNVAQYQALADAAIAQIHARGRLPILAGGTGLYIRSVIEDLLFPDRGPDHALRAELTSFVAEKGPEALHKRLAEVDPATAARLHPNDVRRVIRALEVYHSTGKPLSAHHRSEPPTERYRLAMVAVTRPREILYARIDARVLAQIETGLLDETRSLLASGYDERWIAAQALAYKELIPYLKGEATLPACIERLQRNTRRYAKRQLSWFRQDTRFTWFDLESYPNLEAAAVAVADEISRQLAY